MFRRLKFYWWDYYGCPGHPDDWPDDYWNHYLSKKANLSGSGKGIIHVRD